MSAPSRGLAYFLPCKPGSVYVNVTDRCVNDCRFCIKRDGRRFFGHDLSLNGVEPEAAEIVASLTGAPAWDQIGEIVFCGMGEPLLRYDTVIAVCSEMRRLRGSGVAIRVDTSGLFWARTKRLDILPLIDTLSIGLNAETAEKYEELCRPSLPEAYATLTDFLSAVKREQDTGRISPFPQVRLSVVDTSEEDYLPASGRAGYAPGSFPVPDIEKCRDIAAGFGWPLIVKKLFRDSRDCTWDDKSFAELCARGVSSDICRDCTYRH